MGTDDKKDEQTAGGLTSSEVEELLRRYGQNTIPEARPSEIMMVLKRFWGVIPWMLEAAVILDIILNRLVEACIIAVILLSQALLNTYQEKNTKKALGLLRKRLSVTARVLRDGRWLKLPAADLVPGDSIYLRVGDIVPADVSIIRGTVSVDQSQLTGESLPLELHTGGTVYSGSTVRYGEASGKVIATGKNTFFGKTVQIADLAKPPPRFQQLAVGIAKYLFMLDIVLVLVFFIVTLLQGAPLLGLLPFVLVLLVVSVPVFLPMMSLTSAMRGAGELVNFGVLTTHLPSIENAAAMDVLYVDKTGTITENRLSIDYIEPLTSMNADDILSLAALASDEATQDPMDMAILNAAHNLGIAADLQNRVRFVPFDPTTKRSEAVILKDKKEVRIIKGEPSVVAELARTPWPEISGRVAKLSSNGSRVIAIARGNQSKLSLCGLIALADPPREDSIEFVKELTNRGIRVVLVTGDGKATAQSVASKVGISGEVAAPAKMNEPLQTDAAERFNVFCNVFPQEKFMLVQTLQKAGHTVGMTGDGVNDVPALAQADVGIAVADSTDVAKSAAGLVMTEPGLKGILTAVDVSRKIFQRLQTWVLTMITRKVGIPMFISVGTLFFGQLVVSPLQVVVFMFFGDVATFALVMDNAESSSKPRKWNLKSLASASMGLALVLFLFSCLVFWLGFYQLYLSLDAAQTLVFVWLVFAGGQAVLYSTRTTGFFWEKPYPSHTLLYASAFGLFLATLLASQGWLMAAIPIPYIAGLLGLSLVYLVFSDLVKIATFRVLENNPANGEKSARTISVGTSGAGAD